MFILGIFSCIRISKSWREHTSFFVRPPSKSASWCIRYALHFATS